jgi:hypothetical protein
MQPNPNIFSLLDSYEKIIPKWNIYRNGLRSLPQEMVSDRLSKLCRVNYWGVQMLLTPVIG